MLFHDLSSCAFSGFLELAVVITEGHCGLMDVSVSFCRCFAVLSKEAKLASMEKLAEKNLLIDFELRR